MFSTMQVEPEQYQLLTRGENLHHHHTHSCLHCIIIRVFAFELHLHWIVKKSFCLYLNFFVWIVLVLWFGDKVGENRKKMKIWITLHTVTFDLHCLNYSCPLIRGQDVWERRQRWRRSGRRGRLGRGRSSGSSASLKKVKVRKCFSEKVKV